MFRRKIRGNKSAKPVEVKSTTGSQNSKKNSYLKTAFIGSSLVIITSILIYSGIKYIIEKEIINNPGKSDLVYAACAVIAGYVIIYGLVKTLSDKSKVKKRN